MASVVERTALDQSRRRLVYPPGEKIGVVVVDGFPALGRLAALRFLEWVQSNPDGVISLPAGRIPQCFITEVYRLIDTWDGADTQEELGSAGIDPSIRLRMDGLRFVQIDEFYPINPRRENSFYHYANRYYLKGLGLRPENALLINCEEIELPESANLEEFWHDQSIDLDLRYRNPRSRAERLQREAIYRIDQWCVEYENRVRALGGIGFFLGGIGPDGHIGFNIRGSSPYSATRLTEVNYETQAAVATDLGGIEVARKRLAITIGLATITFNSNCTAIIVAAGEAKADVVRSAIESEIDVKVPASALRTLPNARFYLTEGAAARLTERVVIHYAEKELFSEDETERIVVDLSLQSGKPITDLAQTDYAADRLGKLILQRSRLTVEQLNDKYTKRLIKKIEAGMQIRAHTRFLHTEPHHDDIMLGYLPFVVRHIREHSNYHHFVTMTSGFKAVTNAYMLSVCRNLQRVLEERQQEFRELLASGYFEDDRFRDHDVWVYLDGVASGSTDSQNVGKARRFFRDLVTVFENLDVGEITYRNQELIGYFQSQCPGDRDLSPIQMLKGMCREWESACLWGYLGWNDKTVEHLRLGFYQGETFTDEPTISRDAVPILSLLSKVQPDVVTLAFDPEGTGPDTHYKVMQAVTEGLRLYAEVSRGSDLRIIGYRNIWHRFHPSEANLYIPVSLNMLTLQHASFMNTYISQRDASFPSYEYDGPFSELAQKTQVDQYNSLTTCLGREFFYEHPSALIRATRGFVFVREMGLNELSSHSRELRRRAESFANE